jgi:sulfoxide reductase catalytic subunit YedY
MRAAGAAALGALAAGCGADLGAPGAAPRPTTADGAAPPAGAGVDELGDPTTTYESVTNYNNYYEFTTDKEGVAGLAKGFKTSPWTVSV